MTWPAFKSVIVEILTEIKIWWNLEVKGEKSISDHFSLKMGNWSTHFGQKWVKKPPIWLKTVSFCLNWSFSMPKDSLISAKRSKMEFFIFEEQHFTPFFWDLVRNQFWSFDFGDPSNSQFLFNFWYKNTFGILSHCSLAYLKHKGLKSLQRWFLAH